MKLIDIQLTKTCSLESMDDLTEDQQEKLMELGFVSGCEVCPLNKFGRSLVVKVQQEKFAIDCKLAEKINVK